MDINHACFCGDCIAKQKQTTADRPTTILLLLQCVLPWQRFWWIFLLKKRDQKHITAAEPVCRMYIVCACFLSATGRASAGATDRFSVLGIVCDLWSHYLPLLISNWAGPADQITDSPCVCLLSPFCSLRLHHQFSFHRTHNIKLMCKLLSFWRTFYSQNTHDGVCKLNDSGEKIIKFF
jgi:hypothetical protein